MKVYIAVMDYGHSEISIKGVFSTYELAEEYLKRSEFYDASFADVWEETLDDTDRDWCK